MKKNWQGLPIYDNERQARHAAWRKGALEIVGIVSFIAVVVLVVSNMQADAFVAMLVMLCVGYALFSLASRSSGK